MYVDLQGMSERFGETALIQLTDLASPPTGAVVQAVLDKALADAASLIHGYARSAGYEVPFGSPAPDPVSQWQADIAFYYLHRSKTPSDSLVKDFDRAQAQLRDLAAGRIKLQSAGVSAPAASEDTVLFEGPGRMFTDMGGF